SPQRREGGCGILRTPAPLGIDRPHRHVREDHERSARAALPQVLIEPAQLLWTEPPESALCQFQYIDQPDEVHALRIEAVPATRAMAAPEALEEEPAIVTDRVVLSRDVEDVALHALHDPGGGRELLARGQMAHIPGVDHEAG